MPLSDVAVLGTGNMGSALAAAQMDAGHEVTVWNRTASRTDRLTARGARAAVSVRDAFEAAPVVMLCAGHHDTGLSLLNGAGDAIRGRTIVSLTIGLPEQAKAMARVTEEHGGTFVEGVIMVFPQAIATNACRILYAARESEFSNLRPLLAAFGGTQQLVSSTPGSASALGIASAGFFHLCFQSFAVMAAMAARFGADFATSTPELVAFLEVVGEAMRSAPAVLDGDVRTSDTSTIALGVSEMQDILEATQSLGLDTSLVLAAKNNLERAAARGYGEGPVGSVIHALDPTK